ncbi:MAG: L,D-transpeptidase family protein [Actinomycetota bacterium]
MREQWDQYDARRVPPRPESRSAPTISSRSGSPARRPHPSGKSVEQRRREVFLGAAVVAVLGGALVGGVVMGGDDGDASQSIITTNEAAAGAEAAAAAVELTEQAAAAGDDGSGFVDFIDVDLAGIEDPDPESPQAIASANAGSDAESDGAARADGGCTIEALSLRLGESGDGVRCLQQALADGGYFTGSVDGQFQQSTFDAVQAHQTANELYIDGVVGRETALSLDVWPDEESFVVRTPRPPAGATDLWGVELSPVASAGADAPPLPENSGEGYRVVYDRAGQRVWAVDGDEQIIRSWLVSGSTYSNELPGTHYVYSRSEVSTAWNGKAYLPLMIRWLKTERGNIGFHGIPTKVSDGSVYQTTDELGTRLSGGCQRQHNLDASFLWGFADVGTKVVVT